MQINRRRGREGRERSMTCSVCVHTVIQVNEQVQEDWEGPAKQRGWGKCLSCYFHTLIFLPAPMPLTLLSSLSQLHQGQNGLSDFPGHLLLCLRTRDRNNSEPLDSTRQLPIFYRRTLLFPPLLLRCFFDTTNERRPSSVQRIQAFGPG